VLRLFCADGRIFDNLQIQNDLFIYLRNVRNLNRKKTCTYIRPKRRRKRNTKNINLFDRIKCDMGSEYGTAFLFGQQTLFSTVPLYRRGFMYDHYNNDYENELFELSDEIIDFPSSRKKKTLGVDTRTITVQKRTVKVICDIRLHVNSNKRKVA